MNLFKILASGDGRIDEANVSAFLAYLLNPRNNHGIGDELLKRVIKIHLDQNTNNIELKKIFTTKDNTVRDFKSIEGLTVEVLLEQAFIDDSDQKSIIDVLILFFENNLRYKESMYKSFVSSSKNYTLKHVLLVENKIRGISVSANQIKNQLKATKTTLKNLIIDTPNYSNIFSFIYLTPDDELAKREFAETKKNLSDIPLTHIKWKNLDDDTNSLYNVLKEIMIDENNSIIEPIDEYSKHTIKSFVKFIESDFRTSLQERLFGENNITVFESIESLIEFMTMNQFSAQSINLLSDIFKKMVPHFDLVKISKTGISFFKNLNSSKKYSLYIKVSNALPINIYIRVFDKLRINFFLIAFQNIIPEAILETDCEQIIIPINDLNDFIRLTQIDVLSNILNN